MIRLFLQFSKCFSKKSFLCELDVLRNELQYVDVSKIICPHCLAKASMTPFASYQRNLVSYSGSAPLCHVVTIPRYICISCMRTHAFLPSVMIPYMSFSFGFAIALLKAFVFKTF